MFTSVYHPCAAHSLNLIAVHAASVSVKMISFFGIVQNIFNYFAGSTSRWEVLMRCLKITFKTHNDTRWASKYDAVHSLYCQFGGVIKALRDISTNPIFGDGLLMQKVYLNSLIWNLFIF